MCTSHTCTYAMASGTLKPGIAVSQTVMSIIIPALGTGAAPAEPNVEPRAMLIQTTNESLSSYIQTHTTGVRQVSLPSHLWARFGNSYQFGCVCQKSNGTRIAYGRTVHVHRCSHRQDGIGHFLIDFTRIQSGLNANGQSGSLIHT